jgi:DNA repair protein RecO
MLLEMEVYHKPQRELHTAAQIMPCDYYLNVRSDLEKSALRDAIFEIVIKSVGIHDRQPALYRLLSRYLSLLDAGNNTDLFPCSLWKFLYHLYSILGIEMSFSFCAHCTAQQSAAAALYVNYAKGGIVCSECNCESQSATIPAIIREYCMEKGIVPSPELTTLDPAQKAQITDTFVNYWRYYFDISQPGPAVRFLCSLLTP